MTRPDRKTHEHVVDSSLDRGDRIEPGIAKKDAMSNDNDGSKEDEKHPQALFNEIKMQTTHNLYCPYCTKNIIGDAELSEKRKKSLVMWFPIVFTFEFPFIYLSWFFNNTQVHTVKKSKKHVLEYWLKFLLFVVLLLLSVIVMWTMQSSSHRDNKKLSPFNEVIATSKPDNKDDQNKDIKPFPPPITTKPSNEVQVTIPENQKPTSPLKRDGKIHMVPLIVSNPKKINDENKKPSIVKEITPQPKPEIKVQVPNLENQEKDVKPSSPPKGDAEIHPAQTIVSNPMNTNNGTNQDNKKPSPGTELNLKPKPSDKVHAHIRNNQKQEINQSPLPTRDGEIPPTPTIVTNPSNPREDNENLYTAKEVIDTTKPNNEDTQKKDQKSSSPPKQDGEIHMVPPIVLNPKSFHDDENKKPSRVQEATPKPKLEIKVQVPSVENKKKDQISSSPPTQEENKKPSTGQEATLKPKPEINVQVPILENQRKDQKPSSPPKQEENKKPSTIQEATTKPKREIKVQVHILENKKKDQKQSSPPKQEENKEPSNIIQEATTKPKPEIKVQVPILENKKKDQIPSSLPKQEENKKPSTGQEATLKPKPEINVQVATLDTQKKDQKPSSPPKQDGKIHMVPPIVSNSKSFNDEENKQSSTGQEATLKPKSEINVQVATLDTQKKDQTPSSPPKKDGEIHMVPPIVSNSKSNDDENKKLSRVQEATPKPKPEIKLQVPILENKKKDQIPSSPPKQEENKKPSTGQEATLKPKPKINVQVATLDTQKKDPKLSLPPKQDGEIHMVPPIVSNSKSFNDEENTKPSRVQEATPKPKPEIKVPILENQKKNQKSSSPPKQEENKKPSRIQEAILKPKPEIKVQGPILDNQKKYQKSSSPPKQEREIHLVRPIVSNPKNLNDDNKKPFMVKEVTPKPKTDIKAHVPNLDNQEKDIKPYPPPKQEVEIIPAPPPDDTMKTTKIIISEKAPTILWKYIEVSFQKVSHTELDILKSIVYGGLIMSITSLGVVSSAAASGASTLNVMVLGLANLFSGLFLIIHNLNGLITYQPRYHSANNDHMTIVVAEDPYQILLGNRINVKLHCFVVVASFIFFGVIPPLFYGLSFKRSNKKHYKAVVVFVVSLLCVIFLSFAKAYAFDVDILKTMFEYTGIAIGASTLSFVTSKIVSGMLEK